MENLYFDFYINFLKIDKKTCKTNIKHLKNYSQLLILNILNDNIFNFTNVRERLVVKFVTKIIVSILTLHRRYNRKY